MRAVASTPVPNEALFGSPSARCPRRSGILQGRGDPGLRPRSWPHRRPAEDHDGRQAPLGQASHVRSLTQHPGHLHGARRHPQQHTLPLCSRRRIAQSVRAGAVRCMTLAMRLALRVPIHATPLAVARQSELHLRDNLRESATHSALNSSLHLKLIVSYGQSPVKPGPPGHHLR